MRLCLHAVATWLHLQTNKGASDEYTLEHRIRFGFFSFDFLTQKNCAEKVSGFFLSLDVGNCFVYLYFCECMFHAPFSFDEIFVGDIIFFSSSISLKWGRTTWAHSKWHQKNKTHINRAQLTNRKTRSIIEKTYSQYEKNRRSLRFRRLNF